MSPLKLRRTGRSAPRRRRAAPLVICRWDLDKTYLRSDFDSIRALLRTAFERGEDKIEVPGVATLIRAIKAAAERRGVDARIYFISASPPQIGKAIRDKLALDHVPVDGIVFKNQLEHLRRGKLRNLREHVGFKLAELLRGHLEAPLEARELLFGDDWESDPLIYSLYADVLAGRLGPDRLAPVLRHIPVDPALIEQILALAVRAAGHDTVARIFINLERRTPPGSFRLFGPRVVPTFNYFQTAVVLAADGYLELPDVAEVGRVLLDADLTPRQLENSLDDLVRRGHLELAPADVLRAALRRDAVLGPAPRRGRWRRALGTLVRRRARQGTGSAVSPAEELDYEVILDRLRSTNRGAPEAAPGNVPGGELV